MKKRIAAAAIIVIFTMALGESAWAGRVKNRQFKQNKRIGQGVKSGELTKRETMSLAKQQHRIQHSKKRAWSDGSLNKKERVRLEVQQDKASARIYRLKHNDIYR